MQRLKSTVAVKELFAQQMRNAERRATETHARRELWLAMTRCARQLTPGCGYTLADLERACAMLMDMVR